MLSKIVASLPLVGTQTVDGILAGFRKQVEALVQIQAAREADVAAITQEMFALDAKRNAAAHEAARALRAAEKIKAFVL